MVKSKSLKTKKHYKRFGSMGRRSVDIINEMYSPIDSINRFINLALDTIGENSQSRQFLLESKQGIRKASTLLKRLDVYAKKLEKEFKEMSPK
ncbi:MAG: hypothetical protein PHI59_06680 [Candidatus Omnitrophica bacterium]|nr:hypothetical protein [Candidatus Omnitrophota bacterium]